MIGGGAGLEHLTAVFGGHIVSFTSFSAEPASRITLAGVGSLSSLLPQTRRRQDEPARHRPHSRRRCSAFMSPPQLVHQPLVLPRLVHLRFYLIVVVTIAITALCWWRWPPDGGFESASLAIASLCTTLCIPSTLLLINAHIQAWERPVLQLCVVRCGD